MRRRAVVITVSDRAARGEREDAAGPIAVAALRDAGWACDDARIVFDGDASVEDALRAALTEGCRLIVTTGGTGLGPRDRTPEGTGRVVQTALPGISEELRRRGAEEVATAILSRGVAGVADGALIVNLPGSPAAAASGMPVIVAVAGHAVDQLLGGDHT